jgi:hypothetical protein
MSQEDPSAQAAEQASREAAEDRRQRLAVVQLGIETEQFLTSKLGRYLIARAESEREEAVQKLVDAEPHDRNKVQACQNRVRLVDMFQQWLADAITEGQAQEKSLVDEEIESGGA